MDKLSKTAPSDVSIVAQGLNPHGGADMVVREANSPRGGMFSASSVCFSGSLLIDHIASTIGLNVIKCALKEQAG
jgi:hypothetical protein